MQNLSLIYKSGDESSTISDRKIKEYAFVAVCL